MNTGLDSIYVAPTKEISTRYSRAARAEQDVCLVAPFGHQQLLVPSMETAHTVSSPVSWEWIWVCSTWGCLQDPAFFIALVGRYVADVPGLEAARKERWVCCHGRWMLSHLCPGGPVWCWTSCISHRVHQLSPLLYFDTPGIGLAAWLGLLESTCSEWELFCHTKV